MVCTTCEHGFYSGPTPRDEHFKHPSDLRRAPATKPAAQLLPALVMSFASWVTWLEGVILRASGRMCGLPPAIVSASWQNAKNGHFGGQNTEATPYPSTTAFRRCMGQNGLPNSVFGSVSQDTHRQALTGLSWLSFSRPLDFPTVPEPGQGPAPAVTSRRLPTPANVERTCHQRQARAPRADLQPLMAVHRLRNKTASTK